MPVTDKMLANTILEMGFQKQVPIDPMKLQKLMFYAHGWSLALNGEPLACKGFEAWPYGPVNRNVYFEFNKFGGQPITEYAAEILPGQSEAMPYVISKNDQRAYEIIRGVWDKYANFHALQLSSMTHEPGSPWEYARVHGLRDIPNDVIANYFRTLLRGAA